MKTIQVSEKAANLLSGFVSEESYNTFNENLLQAIYRLTDTLAVADESVKLEGGDLYPLIALCDYGQLASEIHESFTQPDNEQRD